MTSKLTKRLQAKAESEKLLRPRPGKGVSPQEEVALRKELGLPTTGALTTKMILDLERN